MNEKGSMIAEIRDCARDGISYVQFGRESWVSCFEVIEVRHTLGSVGQQRFANKAR